MPPENENFGLQFANSSDARARSTVQIMGANTLSDAFIASISRSSTLLDVEQGEARDLQQRLARR